MSSYCLGCRRRTSGSFVRQGSTRTGRGYSIFKCVECGRRKSVFNKRKRQTGGIVWISSSKPLPNNGYVGLKPILRAYTNLNKVRRPQRGNGFDIQKWIAKTGIEFHPPGYQFLAPGTHLEKRLKRGDKGINRLDRIAKQHDINDSNAGTNIRKKWEADDKMVKAIDKLSGKKSWVEFAARHGIYIKKKL